MLANPLIFLPLCLVFLEDPPPQHIHTHTHSCEHNISVTPWENFIKLGMNVHLNSTKNWLEFSGQSQGNCDPPKYGFGRDLTIHTQIVTKFHTNVSSTF